MDIQDPPPVVPPDPAPVPDPIPNVPNVAPVPPISSGTPTSNKQGLAIASLVVGIVNLCAWIFPICGGPLAVVGIVLGVLGLPPTRRGMAIAGIVLSAIALLLAIINAVAGVLLKPVLDQILQNNGF